MPRSSAPPRSFQEQLLSIMDRKHHWAWPVFSSNRITRAQLQTHFQQEFAVYVRDFPVLLGRLYGRNPPMSIRQELATNLYEEETGGLSLNRSHPALFLEMMAGLGYAPADFDRIRLLPAARAYRGWLDRVTGKNDWIEGLAVMTIFVEGSINDRKELSADSEHHPKSDTDIEATVANHPLVRFHGVSPKAMDLIRAHQRVEGGHRGAAWRMIAEAANTPARQRAVAQALSRSLAYWLRYRDAVARACGIKK